MTPKPDRSSKLCEKNSESNTNEQYHVDPAMFEHNFNTDDMSDVPTTEASMSPNSKRVLFGELSAGFENATPVECEAESVAPKLVQRPISSGEEAPAPPRYQMKAANLRTPQIKRLTVPQPQLRAPQNARPVSPENQVPSQPEKPSPNPETQAAAISRGTSEERPLPRVSPNNPEPPATRGKVFGCASGGSASPMASGDDESGSDNRRRAEESQESNASVRINSSAENRREYAQQFKFAPIITTREMADIDFTQPIADVRETDSAPQPRQDPGRVLTTNTASEAQPTAMDTVLPSIEGGIDVDGTLVDTTADPVMHQRIASAARKMSAKTKAPIVAARPDRQKPVLGGRVTKEATHRPRVQQAAPSPHFRPMSTVSSGPSEEDMLFLLMRRSRLSKERELELAAHNKQLRAQSCRLQEQNRTWHQQVVAVNTEKRQQESDISIYKSEIENFKIRFTKIKDYAKSLAQDHTGFRVTMKKASGYLADLVRETDEIKRNLKVYKQSLEASDETYAGMKSTISGMAREAGTLEQALHVAGEKARISEANLQHERLRNKRIESHILQSQQTQEQLSLSSMQEYRSAAAYLNDLCQTVFHLGKIVTKKLEPKDTPGVEQCLNLLKDLMEKQSAGIVTLAETKTVLSDVSKRLLTYHTTTEEAARAATSQSVQQGRDVLDKMATTLGAVWPSIVTEVEFATLREKNEGLRTIITMGHQAVNEAYEGKKASELREKEQSRRFDKLIDQVAEAMKPPAPPPQPSPPRNTGPDPNVVITKWLQANQSYVDEQRKVVEKEGELQQKTVEIVKLQDMLKSLQAEYDTSQARLNDLEGAQGDAEAAMQRNISLQSQLEKAKAATIQAAKVPALIQDLAERDEEIRELTPKASKVPALDRELAARSQEISKLKPEAARVSVLSQELAAKDREISKLKSEAAKVSTLNEVLAARDQEINKLKLEALRVPALSRELSARDQEISKLKPEASKVPALGKELTARNQEIKKLKPEAAKVLELIPKLAAKDGELAKLQPLASQVPDLIAKVTAKEDELKELRPKAKQISVLAEKLALRDTEISELRPKAAQCDAKSSHNMVLVLEATGYKASIQSLEQQLTTIKQDADSLQKEHEASKAEIAKSQKTIVSLQTELKKSQRSAEQVEVLQKEIVTLTVNFRDHQQLNESLKAQQSANSELDSHIGELQSKLEKEQKLSSQVPTLQEEIQRLSQKYGKLGQELVEAKSAVEKVKALESGVQQKDEEISALRAKMQKTEELGRQLESVQHENQAKSAQMATLQEQIKKLQVDSQRLPGLQKDPTQILDDEENEFPTQQTMLELVEMLNREKVSNMQRSGYSSSTRPDMPQRKRADRTGLKVNEESPSFRKTHDREIQKTQKDPRKHAANIDGSQQIPNSQPQTSARQRDLQNILATSSPLSDLLGPAAHAHGVTDVHGRQKDLFGSSPPFGSSGGEGMLLEAFEGIESTLRDTRVEAVRQQTDRPQSQQSSQKQQGYGGTASRTIVVNGRTETGRHQLRSGMSSQVIPDSQSQEQRLSTPNLAFSSPPGAGVTKHLPNSTAKRPRLDTIEAAIPSQTNSKKLKRTPANLDIRKTPGKRPVSSGTQATDSGRANRVGLPSGSRKGSVIGANAPAPGKAQGRTRASRKGSKSNRYAERFNHE